MHVLLVTIGTGGDVFPYIGIGATLLDRGHRVTLFAPEDFRTVATSHGIDFRGLISVEENHELLSNPDFWHPLKTAQLSARWGVRLIERQYQLIAEHATERNLLLLHNPAVFAAGLVAEKFRIPSVNPILQPWMLASSIAPPVMLGRPFPRSTPRLLLRLFWRFLDVVGDRLVSRHLNPIRASLELPPVRRIFKNWLSPDLVLGMFPDWYGPPQEDWPAQIRLVGFPLFDGNKQNGLPPGLIEFCKKGSPPLVFTFGTGMMHAAKLFDSAIDACKLLGRRAVFLTRYANQLPTALPPFIRHSEFASFDQLFPRCAAVIHHGGVGTTAQALAAGIPQLAVPFAFDQTDNGERVKQLGCGDWLKGSQRDGRSIANAINSITDAATVERCRRISEKFKETEPLAAAADLIEQLSNDRFASKQPEF